MLNLTKETKNKLLLLALAAAWFYVIPVLYQFLFINNDNPKKVTGKIEAYVKKAEQEVEKLSNNKPLLVKYLNHEYDKDDVAAYQKAPFSFQLYKNIDDSNSVLSYWSSNLILPDINDLLQSDGKYAVTKDNGIYEYIKKTISINNTTYFFTAFVPLRWQYFLETDYLKKEFAAGSEIERKYTLSTDPTIYAVKNTDGLVLLYLKKTSEVRNTGFNWIYILCRFFSFVLLLWLFYEIAAFLAKNYSFELGFALFLFLILGIRVLTYVVDFPMEFNAIEFFDPRIYAANYIFKSLGDLSINLFLLLLLVLFWINLQPFRKHQFEKKVVHNIRWVDVFKIIVFIVTTFYTVWLFRSLIATSKISFNVVNLFSLNIYSLVGGAHISLLIILYYLFTVKVLKVGTLYNGHLLIKYLITVVVGLGILYFDFYWARETLCILVLAWMMLYAPLIKYLSGNSTGSIFKINIIWLLFFSVSACILFNYENNKKELADRKWLAQKLAFKSDPGTENLLSIALSRFDDHFLNKNIGKFYDQSNALSYKDSLLKVNFVGYLNKFETKIFTYDSLQKPLNNLDSTSYQDFDAIVMNQGSRVSNIPDLYYYEIGFDLFRYLYKKSIVDTSGNAIGYFVVQSNPLTFKNKSSALYPELFKQRNNRIDDNGNDYIYAIYNNLELRKRFIDYDLATTIGMNELPIGEDTIKYRNGYEEYWLKLNKNSVVVVGKKNNIVIATITLFAYIFFILALVIFFFQFLEALVEGKLNWKYLKKNFQISFTKQVQGIIWMVSLLTFVIVGAVIISLFQSRFNKANKERLSRTMSILIADVQNKVDKNGIFEDVVKIYESSVNKALRESMFQVSEIHNVDFNIYDSDGTLKLSSQPFIESKGILSNKIDPMAYYFLKNKSSAQYVQQEKIGSFEYLSMYVPIRVEAGKSEAYLNIPYYSSQSDLKQEISNFLITIINLNAFIFLIAGLIAWIVTNRITNSFAIISDKMKEVSLGKNEMIVWNRNDEIGGLVNEYNKMVAKLEESASTLAKSEREGAWREMARQVAHEIKNPLTPMKLSIQYLQKSISDGHTDVRELTSRVSKTLVEQIDHLSTIASDFSQFANIGNPKVEDIDVVETLQSLQLLFSNENDVELSLKVNAQKTIIAADKTQINRLFTNLIKNAIQAYEDDVTIKRIDILLSEEDDLLLIAVKDFAKGIPLHLQDKIFTPNFTTKTSGTGLGLAISKGIVEQAKGNIWFSTHDGLGTTFFVQFPCKL